jgi:hypothetical protein
MHRTRVIFKPRTLGISEITVGIQVEQVTEEDGLLATNSDCTKPESEQLMM